MHVNFCLVSSLFADKKHEILAVNYITFDNLSRISEL